MSCDGCYHTTKIHSGPFNICCSGCVVTDPNSVCGCNAFLTSPNQIKCYQNYYTSQSFYLRNQNHHRHEVKCDNYLHPCGSTLRIQQECSPCSGQSTPSRIRSYTFGKRQTPSPYRGGGSDKEVLRSMHKRQSTVVRGAQLSQSAYLRSLRPAGNISRSRLGHPTVDGTANVLNKYPPKHTTNDAVQLPCCPPVTTVENGTSQKLPCLQPCNPVCSPEVIV